ncbi:hypothetical protein ABZ769_35450 [Streptomyces olivoreticuli]
MLALDLLLGPERAAAVLRELADDLVHQDHLDADVALRMVCERATDGDPLLIAGPGQVWALRDDADLDDAPSRRLAVHARLTCDPRVLVSDPDDETGQIDELLIDVLDLYQLDTWTLEPAAPTH